MASKNLYIDDSCLSDYAENIEIVKSFGKRKITHVFHDIDGTHSMIRDWVPVMSLTLYNVIENGLSPEYDSSANIQELIRKVGQEQLDETDSFCIESAGLSALTQMEWAIRRAIENGSISSEKNGMDANALKVNREIIKRIWNGEERFEYFNESDGMVSFLAEHTTRLFKMYESILNGACRDANLVAALNNPDKFLVDGSFEFIRRLHELGAVNYFVTGAVINYNEAGQPEGGIYEEVCTLGFDIGIGRSVEAVYGSTWDEKIPKDEVMKKLCKEQNINPESLLIVGDGRSEISAGVSMGAITISRLPINAVAQRNLHKQLATNLIIPDYSSPAFYSLFYESH